MFQKIEHYEENKKAIYLRKSQSDDPKEPIEKTLARHEKVLLDVAKRLDITVKKEDIYKEVVSGDTIQDRPEFKRLLGKISDGYYNGLIVYSVDRLSRGGTTDQGIILDTLVFSNTKVIVPSKVFDLSNKYDREQFEMYLFMSRREYTAITGRMQDGRQISLSEGKYIYSVCPYGYDKEKIKDDKGYKLIPHKEEKENVILLFEMFLDGVGTSNLANSFNKMKIKARKSDTWTPAMIRNILTNPVYIGYLTNDRRKTHKKMVDGIIKKSRPYNEKYHLIKAIHEPLISEDTFYKAQDILKRNSSHRVPKNTELKNPLSGLVFCGVCGRSMFRRPHSTKQYKKNKLKYNIDKKELLEFLRKQKEKSNLSLKEISDCLNVSKNSVDSWFAKNINKFYISQTLIDNWDGLRSVLSFGNTKYDKLLTTFENVAQTRQESLICALSGCKNVSSDLYIVEKRIIESLENILKEYNYFLDNYEQEYTREIKSNAKTLNKIEKEIEALKKELKNARRSYNREEFSFEEYQETKKEVEEELKNMEEEKENILNTQGEDKVLRYKKAIPILENCIKEYYTLNIIEKNELLKTIIEKVIYTKKVGGRWNKTAIDNFQLDLFLKI